MAENSGPESGWLGAEPESAAVNWQGGRKMPIQGTVQPEFLAVDEAIRLRRFDGVYDFAFDWYQDEDVVWVSLTKTQIQNELAKAGHQISRYQN